MRVLISGAGIAGLTLALCLYRRGHEPVLLEKTSRLRGDGYMIDFFGPGYRAAERMGLLPRLQALHHPVARMAFITRAGTPRFAIPYEQLQALADGRALNFMRGELERALSEELAGRVPIRFNTEVLSVREERDAVSVTLSDAKRYSCDLLVGADGVHSKVRSLCFGSGPSCLRYLGFHAAACIVERPAGLSELDDTFFTVALPGRQAVVYPIGDGRAATFFVHADASPLFENVQFAIRSRLEQLYGDLGWHFPELLRLQREAPYVYYDTVSQVIMKSWTRGRIALLGDACGCVSLLSGQGASLAMAGAYALAEELELEADIPTALLHYERRLRPLVERKQQAGRSFAKWFVPKSALRCAVRDLAMRTLTLKPAAYLFKRQLAGGEEF